MTQKLKKVGGKSTFHRRVFTKKVETQPMSLQVNKRALGLFYKWRKTPHQHVEHFANQLGNQF